MRYAAALLISAVALSVALAAVDQVAGGISGIHRHWWSTLAIAGAAIVTTSAWFVALRRGGSTRRS